MGLNVLSLCDGMSCGQISLVELGVTIDAYNASEIDKKAIKVTQDNFPNTIQLGDVMEIHANMNSILSKLPKIDIVMFGFPCRSLSSANQHRKQYNNGLKGVSGLFYYCNDILQWIKQNNNSDVEFLVENVDSSKTDDLNEISKELGVEPVMIDSGWFSAQDRRRLYWTNIDVREPVEKSTKVIEDIMDQDIDEKYFYNKDFEFFGEDKHMAALLNLFPKRFVQTEKVCSKKFKSFTLIACRGGHRQIKVYNNGRCRKLTPNEYRKLQTIPDWYKMNVADSHIYNMCGDGWTIEVIKYILSFAKCVRRELIK